MRMGPKMLTDIALNVGWALFLYTLGWALQVMSADRCDIYNTILTTVAPSRAQREQLSTVYCVVNDADDGNSDFVSLMTINWHMNKMATTTNERKRWAQGRSSIFYVTCDYEKGPLYNT